MGTTFNTWSFVRGLFNPVNQHLDAKTILSGGGILACAVLFFWLFKRARRAARRATASDQPTT